ncbi:MAG TPA: hypothetical protein DCX25_01150 [Candidatus Pacebacteria bacterium]|nr:MAG: hypothetical protein UX00_C0010G0018 [Microgenomates group bacterium GW2011_GWB1_45_17]KKU23580.1 MAG: hypothetical protein UX36_C0004G0033 [Microgenomates group bacterium GW2011_GWC1_46_15]KKU24299.1 MAG: hypothetical protein UX35_C0002G0033 [Microgenomates group bacterium GW2011_GWA1_46_15]HAV14916.1 hypothetical protein [Candidatus Paceibacterota bacterium]HCR11333.1 hypothetical protein [Candidatus Paceibacterota bacterium]
MRNIDIWKHIKHERTADYYIFPGCLYAEGRFLLFLMWANHHHTQIQTERLHIVVGPHASNARCIQKNIGERTYLCLEGPFAGTIVTPDIRGNNAPLRALYEHPIGSSCDFVISSIVRPSLPKHLEQFDQTKDFLPFVMGLLTYLRLPIEQHTFKRNIEDFSAITADGYAHLVKIRTGM